MTDLAKGSKFHSVCSRACSEFCCLNGNAQLRTAVAALTYTHTYTLHGLTPAPFTQTLIGWILSGSMNLTLLTFCQNPHTAIRAVKLRSQVWKFKRSLHPDQRLFISSSGTEKQKQKESFDLI